MFYNNGDPADIRFGHTVWSVFHCCCSQLPRLHSKGPRVTLDGTMTLVWQYDLNTSSFASCFGWMVQNVMAVVQRSWLPSMQAIQSTAKQGSIKRSSLKRSFKIAVFLPGRRVNENAEIRPVSAVSERSPQGQERVSRNEDSFCPIFRVGPIAPWQE
jgi:hypothetical protein